MNVGREPGRRSQPQSHLSGARPGQMTAVMRAMSVAEGPKVLRIGVVRGGRVVEERVVKQRISVTVGTDESSMFAIAASHGAPRSLPLFALISNDYYLTLVDEMKGRIALASGITDLDALRSTATNIDGAFRLKLGDDARGKVVIGDTTFLFQFVAAPPVQPKPRLPLGVKGTVGSAIDWSLTIIAACSFLFHFGLVGGMYSDWMDPIVRDDITVGNLVDMMSKIPPAPIETPDQIAMNEPTAPKTPPKETDKTTSTTPTTTGTPSTTPGRSTSTQSSNDKTAALVAQAEAMEMQTIAGLNNGPSVKNALDRSNVVAVDLSSAAEREIGVGHTPGGLKVVSGGPVQGGTNKNGLAGITGDQRGTSVTNAGPETVVAGPTGVAQVGAPITNGTVSDADVVVANMRGRFRSCYQTGLSGDPTMSGKVLVSAKIGPNGEVSNASVTSNTGLSPAVAQCIANVVGRATFKATGGGSTLQIPVTFVQQGK